MGEISTRWSANVISDGAAQLWYFLNGRPVTQASPGALDIGSPEEHLLLAAAGSYALCCRDVLAHGPRNRHPFEVIATARASAGSALSQLALTCIFSSDLSPAEAERVAGAAQRQCAVTGALPASAGVSYQMRVLQKSLRGLGGACGLADVMGNAPLAAGARWSMH